MPPTGQDLSGSNGVEGKGGLFLFVGKTGRGETREGIPSLFPVPCRRGGKAKETKLISPPKERKREFRSAGKSHEYSKQGGSGKGLTGLSTKGKPHCERKPR